MTAYRLDAWGSPPRLTTVPIPRPGPRDALIRVAGAGACRSDLHLMHRSDATGAPWPAGFVLGHENAGWVVEVGGDVRDHADGDAVIVMGAWGCGSCARCVSGVDPYCDHPERAAAPGGGGGLGLDGGMAEYMVVRDADRHLVPLPSGLPVAEAAPLSDAALTSYHAVRRSLPKLADPDATVTVVGIGGLGGFAVQALKGLTQATIVAVDVRPESRETAGRAGAHHLVAPDDTAAEKIRDITSGRGSDVVLDFVGSPDSLDLASSIVRPLGDLTVVGAAGGAASVGFGQRLPNEVSVQTTYWGSRSELADVVDLAARGVLSADVTTYPLDAVADAYRDLGDGRINGRAVILP
ncbi:alcohol dehydrogenase catalytic domain-containing protein [Gordonia sp. HNM0687]|uniref:alcohol dehydrogenase n=2 Tax=Gordonia mangrovi TaxID=2665643 RepID=A0A6L7GMH7_9ACTN|nr:alcohol dehydrogenase catalytic domain-containing protein [Gordonia mangrovi]